MKYLVKTPQTASSSWAQDTAAAAAIQAGTPYALHHKGSTQNRCCGRQRNHPLLLQHTHVERKKREMPHKLRALLPNVTRANLMSCTSTKCNLTPLEAPLLRVLHALCPSLLGTISALLCTDTLFSSRHPVLVCTDYVSGCERIQGDTKKCKHRAVALRWMRKSKICTEPRMQS